ncbi:hypothetical protein Hanom_Chr02g00135111 [Helianthus anomalus]
MEKEEDIAKQDWCSYVLESLRPTRHGWKRVDSQYNGPVAFLTLLYTHEYNKRHRLFKEVVELHVIKYITSHMIDDMEDHLYNNGSMTDVEHDNDDQENDPNENQPYGDHEECEPVMQDLHGDCITVQLQQHDSQLNETQ